MGLANVGQCFIFVFVGSLTQSTSQRVQAYARRAVRASVGGGPPHLPSREKGLGCVLQRDNDDANSHSVVR
jgi:hypothetical protein